MDDCSTGRVGLAAAIASAVLSIAYVGGQLLEWFELLGSAGGPESTSTSVGIYILLTPSILLAPAFVVMIAAIYLAAPKSGRIFGLCALAFAIIYAMLVSLVYFVQLTLVAPRLESGLGDLAFLRFVPYHSFLFAADLLGYSFMCLSALAAGFALSRGVKTRSARRLLLANGLLTPFLVFQMYVPVLIWPAALWAVAFPCACIAVARAFAGGAAISAEA